MVSVPAILGISDRNSATSMVLKDRVMKTVPLWHVLAPPRCGCTAGLTKIADRTSGVRYFSHAVAPLAVQSCRLDTTAHRVPTPQKNDRVRTLGSSVWEPKDAEG